MLDYNQNRRDCRDYFHDEQCIGSNCHLRDECIRWWPKYESIMKTFLDEKGRLQCTGRLENKIKSTDLRGIKNG